MPIRRKDNGVIGEILNGMCLLAEEGAKAAEPGAQGGPFNMLIMFAPIILLFYFLIMRPERRKQAEHKQLLEAIKKNDRVVTIGGIYGVVANVQRDADRVTLKIDEANNIKIDVTFNAIARVMMDEPPAEEKK
jgi:preprotein translocase subunit YajC